MRPSSGALGALLGNQTRRRPGTASRRSDVAKLGLANVAMIRELQLLCLRSLGLWRFSRRGGGTKKDSARARRMRSRAQLHWLTSRVAFFFLARRNAFWRLRISSRRSGCFTRRHQGT